MGYRRPQSYEERLLALSTKLERLLFRIAIAGFAGIIVSQLVLSVSELGSTLSTVDRLEGQQISQDKAQMAIRQSAEKELTIRPVSDKAVQAWAKVNGVPIAQIVPSGTTIKVKKDEVLEIDTSAQEGIYRFEIDHNDPTITYPTPGTLVETSQAHAAVLKPILFQDE